MDHREVNRSTAKRAPRVLSRQDDVTDMTTAMLVRDAIALRRSSAREPPPRHLQVEYAEPPPVQMTLNVRFLGSTDDKAGTLPSRDMGGRPGGLAALLEGITEQDIEALRELEPRILKWIAAGEENAARFYADPLAALELAGIELQGTLRKRVERVRHRSTQLRARLPRTKIKSIKPGL